MENPNKNPRYKIRINFVQMPSSSVCLLPKWIEPLIGYEKTRTHAIALADECFKDSAVFSVVVFDTTNLQIINEQIKP